MSGGIPAKRALGCALRHACGGLQDNVLQFSTPSQKQLGTKIISACLQSHLSEQSQSDSAYRTSVISCES